MNRKLVTLTEKESEASVIVTSSQLSHVQFVVEAVSSVVSV